MIINKQIVTKMNDTPKRRIIKNQSFRLIPTTEGQVRQYMKHLTIVMCNNTENSYDGEFNTGILRVRSTNVRAKQFRNMFNNDVII